MENRPGSIGGLDRRSLLSGVVAGIGEMFKSSKVIRSFDVGKGTEVDLLSLMVRMPD
jgi:hypothetical protein